MKGLLSIFRGKSWAHDLGTDPQDSQLFSAAFAEHGADAAKLVTWESRAPELRTKRLSASRGTKLLSELWQHDRYMARVPPSALGQLDRFFNFSTIESGQDIILQDEYSNFMVVVLTGTVAVDRLQPWGEQLRLAETRPGDILGEMSLLDSGLRFSTCTSLTETEVAILSAHALDDMQVREPQMASCLVALLARKLSLRLRVVSARLSEYQ